MTYPPLRALCLLLLVLVSGCASLAGTDNCPCATQSTQENAPELDAKRQMLSEGYSLLYRDASNLDLSSLVLHLKFESDDFKQIINEISEFGGELKADLERLDRDYPGVRIDLDPLPELEKRKRWAIGETRARYFAPVVGRSGREYERTLLIGLLNGMNHERHMCQVMAEEETDPGLKQFLQDTRKRFDSLYNRADDLLNAQYFRHQEDKGAN